MGALDLLKWTYDGIFEQLFGPGRGDLNKNFPKAQMTGGMLKLGFNWYIYLGLLAWLESRCLPHTYCLYNWQDNISLLDLLGPENAKKKKCKNNLENVLSAYIVKLNLSFLNQGRSLAWHPKFYFVSLFNSVFKAATLRVKLVINVSWHWNTQLICFNQW